MWLKPETWFCVCFWEINFQKVPLSTLINGAFCVGCLGFEVNDICVAKLEPFRAQARKYYVNNLYCRHPMVAWSNQSNEQSNNTLNLSVPKCKWLAVSASTLMRLAEITRCRDLFLGQSPSHNNTLSNLAPNKAFYVPLKVKEGMFLKTKLAKEQQHDVSLNNIASCSCIRLTEHTSKEVNLLSSHLCTNCFS